MNYVLIGGSGFIGQHFRKALQDDIIVNLDINEGVNNDEFHFCDINEEIKLSLDLSGYEAITVVHLAAVHFDFQRSYYKTNITGTKNVLEWIWKQPTVTNYVFFSSVATYGETIQEKNESDDQNPINDYGKSKLEAERIIIPWTEKTQMSKLQ